MDTYENTTDIYEKVTKILQPYYRPVDYMSLRVTTATTATTVTTSFVGKSQSLLMSIKSCTI
jgi:hypothetical protein